MQSGNNSSFPQPLFAPAHGGNQGAEDLDFNEIFAEYFINEFDDPMNAYTSTMGNFTSATGVTNPLQQQPQQVAQVYQQQAGMGGGGGVVVGGVSSGGGGIGGAAGQLSLPTGGIRTAFHGSTSSSNQQDQMMKKAKVENHMGGGGAQVATSGGISFDPQSMQAAMLQQQLQQTAQQQQQQQQQQAQIAAGGGVTLPVGHGIRLGGVGGLGPHVTQAQQQQQQLAMAHQQAQQQAGMGGLQDLMWGGQVMTGGPSEQAVAERRQRNREHAKRSRVRKKFMLESLQGEVQELQRENQRLRMLVQEHIQDNPQQIIAECCSTNPLFADDDPDGGDDDNGDGSKAHRKPEKLVKADYSLMASLTMGQQCFVLSDPKLPDNPIVFASPGFYKLTGYTSKEVLGRNCRFLQGPATNPKAVEVLKKSIAAGTDCTVCLINYKADGTPFWNQLFVAALRDSDNCIVNFVGVQCEVEPEAGANALEDRVNEVLPLQAKDGDDQD